MSDTDHKVYDQRVATIWQDEDGIVYLVSKPGTVATLEDMVEQIRIIKEISQGEKVAILADVSGFTYAHRDNRALAAGPDGAAIFAAVALVAPSPANRVLAEIFLRTNKPMYPARLFLNQEEASAWLRQFVH